MASHATVVEFRTLVREGEPDRERHIKEWSLEQGERSSTRQGKQHSAPDSEGVSGIKLDYKEISM